MKLFYLYLILALLSCALGAYLYRIKAISRRTLSLVSIALLIPSTPFLAGGSFLLDIMMHVLFMVLFQFGIFTEVMIESVAFWVDED